MKSLADNGKATARYDWLIQIFFDQSKSSALKAQLWLVKNILNGLIMQLSVFSYYYD